MCDLCALVGVDEILYYVKRQNVSRFIKLHICNIYRIGYNLDDMWMLHQDRG